MAAAAAPGVLPSSWTVQAMSEMMIRRPLLSLIRQRRIR